MIGLPKKYEFNKKIDIKTFINNSLKPVDKKRLKETLKQVTLTYQIQGEEIPSLISEEYNCQAIMFLDIEVNSVKDAAFVGGIIQNQIKSSCVLNIHDNNKQQYCFAEKRLNIQDRQNVVIENMVITKESSLFFYDNTKELLEKYLNYNSIQLKDNKMTFYRELITKAYIICELNYEITSRKLLESNLWYNTTKVKELLDSLKELERLKLQMNKIKSPKDKIELNKLIKIVNEKVKEIL